MNKRDELIESFEKLARLAGLKDAIDATIQYSIKLADKEATEPTTERVQEIAEIVGFPKLKLIE